MTVLYLAVFPSSSDWICAGGGDLVVSILDKYAKYRRFDPNRCP
jgi:hypothetical protein